MNNNSIKKHILTDHLKLRISSSILSIILLFVSILILADKMYVERHIHIFLYRVFFLSSFIVFLNFNIWLPIKELYSFIFKYRVIITLALFFFFVANKFHCSSIGMYNNIIQPNISTEYCLTILGSPRPIRSDEWLVSTPMHLTTKWAGVGSTNDIPMARKLSNLTSSSLEMGLNILSEPSELGYYTGNIEIGVSFEWAFRLIITPLLLFEFFYIITKKKKLLSVLGSVLIAFSSFNLWWSVCTILIYTPAIIVFLYYAVTTESSAKRFLFGLLTAISGSSFIVLLYPAWQVPCGYLLLALLIYILISNKDVFKSYKKSDWLILVICVLVMILLAASYMLTYKEYISLISQTVYPGKRVEYGGFSLGKLANAIPSLIFPFVDYSNPCEAGIVLCLFPLPIIASIIYYVRYKKNDFLITGLLIVSVFLSIYCTIGLPKTLCTVTLMTYTTASRCIDIFAVIQLILLIAVLSKFENEDGILGRIPAFIITAAILLYSGLHFIKTNPDYINHYFLIAFILLFSVLIAIVIGKNNYNLKVCATVLICIIFVTSGLSINPLMKGLDTIYSKPAAEKVIEICQNNPDAKWISTYDIVGSGFLISCGAKTINSVNTVPYTEFWSRFDTNGSLEEYYNRYEHVTITLTPDKTSFDLPTPDHMVANIAYDDLHLTEADYIFSNYPIESNDSESFESIYSEDGIFIYHITYK